MSPEDDILAALRDRAGLDAALVGESSMRAEIARALAACPDHRSLLDPLSPGWTALLESVLIPETWFFRNIEAFNALSSWVAGEWLPAHPSSILRVLSLPCATGEEAYSIAMILLEAGLDPAGFRITAGDIGPSSLRIARAAAYSRNAFRGSFPESRFGRFFEPAEGGRRRVAGHVRRLVNFEPLNLVEGDLPSSDVIFCRNALIYFSAHHQNLALTRLGSVLSPDGILFLGPVEPPLALRAGFSTTGWPMSFAVRKSAASPLAPVRSVGSVPSMPAGKPAAPAPSRKVFRSPQPLPRNLQKQEDRLAATLEAARTLADAGDFPAALDVLGHLHAAAPPTAESLCLAGIVRETLGQTDEAERCFRQALFLDPRHYESLAHLSLLLELSGRKTAAAPFRLRAARLVGTP